MDISFFERLHANGDLSSASLQKVKEAERNKLFSLHWELRTVLYLGILLLTSGLGTLVYKNIDTIGHQAILLFIAAISAGSFFYCFKKKAPCSNKKVASPNSFFDYVLLLGCLTLVTFIGYLQFQYNVFGTRYGLATFIPMLILFATAYYFDHLGVLSMAITTLAAWAGFAITPATIIQGNEFESETMILTAALLGIFLLACGYFSVKRKIKAHFEFTYSNFGMHLLFISVIATMLIYDQAYAAWFLLLAGIAYFFYTKALRDKSFYIVLMLTAYFYIGLSYTVVRLLFDTASMDIGGVYLSFFYFILSGIALILFLIKMNKKIKAL